MLERVQIAPFAKRYPRYLSGGQQQRVALARALVCQPRLLLLDEPLGALDARLREQMQIVLKDLQRELTIAFIHVTHDQAEAMALADRIVVMRSGVIEQVDSPEGLYHRPVNAFVADFLGTTNLFDGKCLQQDGDHVLLETQGCLIHSKTALPVAPGESVSLSVRPSSIVLNPENGEFENSFTGEIEGIVYRGEQWSIHLKAGAFHLIVLVPSSLSRNAGVEIGQQVRFSWHAEDCWLMKREGGE
jgi:putative spermidine/putrescine transport system ATP-binding protein